MKDIKQCGKILFVGDWLPVCPVDVRVLFGESAATVGNLECALSRHPAGATKAYSVVLPPETVTTIVQAGFAALNLANNHVCDAGDAAFHDMLDMLHAVKGTTQYYGTCKQPHAELVVGGLRCAVIGCLEPSRSRGRLLFPQEGVCSLIEELRPHFERIYVTPHWGKEGEYAFHPSPAQRGLARKWLRAGANGICGHHSHTVQGMEKVDDCVIIYSLGNFSFPHEEGKRFPLTNAGLSATVSPSDNHCKLAFTRFEDDGRVVELSGKIQEFSSSVSKTCPMIWREWMGSLDIGAGPVRLARLILRRLARAGACASGRIGNPNCHYGCSGHFCQRRCSCEWRLWQGKT